MTNKIVKILEDVANNKIRPNEAYELIKKSNFIDIDDIVKFDKFRDSRTGVPEVVYAEFKTSETCLAIIDNVLQEKDIILFTRLTSDTKNKIMDKLKTNPSIKSEIYGNSIIIYKKSFTFPVISNTSVGIITAGTSDVPVAQECEAVLKVMGIETHLFHDIGVAGLHRLIGPLEKVLNKNIDVLVVIAGMEGALPSIVAGLIDIPVIAVPVSVGYGVRPAGEVALLSMLSSCSPGIGVVNIDAGFNAGALAGLIALRCSKEKKFNFQ